MDEVRAVDGADVSAAPDSGFAASLLWELGRLLKATGNAREAADVHAELLRNDPASPFRILIQPPGDLRAGS